MQYISTRKVTAKSKNLLIALDELGSLRIEKELLLDSVRRFRKRKCKLLILIQSISDLRILYGEEVTKAILANIKYKVLLSGLGIPEEQRYFAELIGHENNEWKIEPADLDRQGKNTVILIASDEPGGYLKLKKNYFFK